MSGLPEAEVHAFADRCLGACAHIVGAFVDKWAPHFADRCGTEKATKFVRAQMGMTLLSVAASQLRLVGANLPDARAMLAEAWEDWTGEPNDAVSSKGPDR